MSIVINPENSVSALSKDEVSQASNVVFWLPCDETGTITTLTDAVSGGTVTIESSTASGGGIAIPTDASSAFSGTLPALSGDFAILLMCTFGGIISSISYGTGAQKIIIGSSGTEIIGASGTDTLDTVSAATTYKLLITKDADGDAFLYAAAVGADLAAGNTLNPVSASGVVTPSANALSFSAFGSEVNVVYGMAVIDLATDLLPSDIVTWADWTLEQWYANNKVLPARFAEL